MESKKYLHQPQIFDATNITEPEPAASDLLSKWSELLPKSPRRLLDVACGTGIEAAALSRLGFEVEAIDASPAMVETSIHPKTRLGTTEQLPFPDQFFTGAWAKDVWLFLSPSQREGTLKEMHRVLVPGGQALIVGELTDVNRARYIPHDSAYPQVLSSIDFPDFEGWAKAVDELNATANVFSIEYTSKPEDATSLALRTGFSTANTSVVDQNSPISKENRWLANRRIFVAKLTK
jgi:ubiquinone/menaquinone biosynthesis C-methylase UbiE